MLSSALKYAEQISALALPIACPDSSSNPREFVVAYRLVNEPIGFEDNFTPQSIKRERRNGSPPKRRLDPKDHEWFCEEWGLSMFSSLQKMKAFFQGNPRLIKAMGCTHIASGPITLSDGVCTTPDDRSHFNLFEFEQVDLTNKFSIVDKVI